ncbi:hypothetical protein C0995_010375 [Termitomyces sp. Mi166|nr:hypothetical protein C0995_010375 [Termitomyces sp. Mi166\
MRKTSYVLTFFVVAITLLLNVFSITHPDWLIVQTPEVLGTRFTITYGLSKRCESQVTRIPGNDHSKFEYSDYQCRSFPKKVSDGCEEENAGFCAAWTSARYFVELAAWSAAASLCAIAFGVSTHSRRRRIWRVAAGLILLQDLYSNSQFPTFENARLGKLKEDFFVVTLDKQVLGPAYIFNIVSWIFGIFNGIAVITTGVSADQGHKWAAGNRAYRRIPNV